MREEGTVRSYGPMNYGFIEGDSGEIYFFMDNEWHLPIKPKPRLRVEFTRFQHEKGMRAADIQRVRRKKWEMKS